MRERWILFYNGACPVCNKLKKYMRKHLRKEVKLTVVDLRSAVAQAKGYNSDHLILETSKGVFRDEVAFYMVLSQTKFSFLTKLGPKFVSRLWVLIKNNKEFFNNFLK